MLKLLSIFLILSACATPVVPPKLDCEFKFMEVDGETRVSIDVACTKKIRELQIRCGK